MSESVASGGERLVLPDPERFNSGHRAQLDRPVPWHPYRHQVRVLPRKISELASGLGLEPGARILDYGCADTPYRRFFDAGADYVAADLPGNPNATLELGPGAAVPAEDASFDAVLSTQVLEHVADPAAYLAECFRVLRPGGRLLLSTHGIFVYHPDPVDYWRWTCAGLEKAVTDAGFAIERFEGIVGVGATGIQLLQDSIYYRLRLRPLQHLVAVFFQTLVAIADRLERDSDRRLNATGFALVASRP